jgi:hypothetical protein
MKGILEELQMNQEEFKEICILSGTDYNINANGNNDNVNLSNTIKLLRKYKACNQKIDFYSWLLTNTEYITDIELLTKIKNIFDLSVSNNLDLFKKIKIINGPIIREDIKNILKDDGFIFVN